MLKKIRPEYAILIGLFAFLMGIASTVEYRRMINYIFGDEAVYYMMAQSFAYDLDLEYTQKDLWRVYEDGWHAGPQGVFLTQIADFTLTDESLQQLRRERLPDEFPIKLNALKDNTINTRARFLNAVEETLETRLTPEQRKAILKHTRKENTKIYYSKSFAYALLLAPFLAAFGFQGFLILNMLLLFIMIVMGWLYLRQYNASLISLVLVITFFLLSASFIYTYWLTPETFNMFCITFGLFLWLYKREKRQIQQSQRRHSKNSWLSAPFRFVRWLFTTPNGRLYLAPIPIAVAGASKLPNVLFIFPIAADVLLEGYLHIFSKRKTASSVISRPLLRWRSSPPWRYAGKLIMVCAIFVIILMLFYVLQYVFTGNFNQYSGDRRTFYWRFPFDSARDIWEKGIRLSNDDYFEESFYVNPSVLLHNAYYYIFGRFTGLLPYFFCSFIALYYCGRRFFSTTASSSAVTRRNLLLLLTIGGNIFVYIFMAPGNYQGGGGAFGNRFFVNIYPAFLFLITSFSSLYPLVVSWVVGSLFLAQVLINPFQISTYPASQAFRMPYRLLPVELTLLNTLPTYVNSHLVQSAVSGKQEAHRLYFFDENSTDQTPYDFWVRGEKTVEMAVRLSYPRDYLTVTIKNGPIGNQVDVTVAGSTQTVHFGRQQEIRQLIFPLDKGVPYFKTEVYPVKICSHSGFVPKFTAGIGLDDPRYLGCRVSISSNLFDAGKVLVEQGHFQQAMEQLQAVLNVYPLHAQAEYYLGRAYLGLQRPEDAQAAFLRAKALLPNFQAEFWAYCRSLKKDCRPKEFPHPPDEPLEASLDELLEPFRIRFEAEDFLFSTGERIELPDASHGKVVEFHPGQHSPGFLQYGQFQVLPEGQYQARFRIKTGRTNDASAPLVTTAFSYDVFGKRQGIIVKDLVAVHADELFETAAYREYILNFELYSPETVEFRVETTGQASVTVDRIEVYHRLPLQVFEGIAESQQRLGETEKSYHTLQQVIRLSPSSPECQRAYLQLLFELHKWEEASQFIQDDVTFSEFQSGLLTGLFEENSRFREEWPPGLQQLAEEALFPVKPEIPMNIVFDDRIEFQGYSLSNTSIAPGDTFSIHYFWKAVRASCENYTISVHFTKKGGLFVSETATKIKRRFNLPGLNMFQQNHEPLHGTYPTEKWLPDEFIHEQYNISAPHDIEPGTYEIRIGLWNPLTGDRLRDAEGQHSVKIGELHIDDARMD